MMIFVVSVLTALSVSFVCSVMEAAFLSLTPSQVADLTAKRPGIGAIWERFKADIEKPIAVILILNTSAHTIGAAVAGSKFNDLFGDQWITAFSLIFTFLMVQFTEILPKTLGVRYNREFAVVIARPLSFLVGVLTPLLHLIHWINRPFESRRENGRAPSTIEEITALAGLARLSNEISKHQERIIKGASRLSRLKVRDLMIPAEQVAFLSTTQKLSDAIVAAHLEAHTRFPVCEGGDRNRVVGYVNFKEMVYFMRTNPADPSFRGITRPVHFTSPDESASSLLKVFVDQHEHIAVVRDNAGDVLGLVTLEDLVEELLGELEDEFDRLPRMAHALSGGTWMMGGSVPVSEVVARVGVALPDANGMLSSWLLRRFARTPKPGDVLREGTLEFTVRRVRRGRVFEVAVSPIQPAASQPPGNAAPPIVGGAGYGEPPPR